MPVKMESGVFAYCAMFNANQNSGEIILLAQLLLNEMINNKSYNYW
jgi:hypothetical protein